jgi:hypothetical protein
LERVASRMENFAQVGATVLPDLREDAYRIVISIVRDTTRILPEDSEFLCVAVELADWLETINPFCKKQPFDEARMKKLNRARFVAFAINELIAFYEERIHTLLGSLDR